MPSLIDFKILKNYETYNLRNLNVQFILIKDKFLEKIVETTREEGNRAR